jgi:hypothetical protein
MLVYNGSRKIIRVAEVHLQTLQGKLEHILVEVCFNDSEVFCFFSFASRICSLVNTLAFFLLSCL